MADEKFDPKKHLIQLKGRWYLETKYRVLWFRQDHPDGSIVTEIISTEPPLVQAKIVNGSGQVLATGHAGANDKGTQVWSGRSIEKSETAAIGRALANAGYGTQFCANEMDDGQAGGGVDRRSNRPSNTLPRQSPRPNSQPPADNPVVQTAQANGGTVTKMDKPDATGKAWTEAEAKAFSSRWQRQSLSQSDLLAALGVTRLGEWKQSRADADAAVDAWLLDRINDPVAS